MKYPQNVFFLLLMVVIALTGCMRKVTVMPPERALAEVSAESLVFDDDLDTGSLTMAIDRSLHYYDGAGRDQMFRVADRSIGVKQMKETLFAFRKILQSDTSIEQKKKQIAGEFTVLRASGDAGDGAILFTGYYEPLLEGSLTRTDKYKYPLYRPPPDIVMEKVSKNETRISRKANGRPVPYYTRREIDIDGALQGKGLELIWVSDPVELNSLHIQGSGKIKMEDGKMLTVSYAQNNGRPFRSVTRFMLDQNRIDKSDTSYRNFKTWLNVDTKSSVLGLWTGFLTIDTPAGYYLLVWLVVGLSIIALRRLQRLFPLPWIEIGRVRHRRAAHHLAGHRLRPLLQVAQKAFGDLPGGKAAPVEHQLVRGSNAALGEHDRSHALLGHLFSLVAKDIPFGLVGMPPEGRRKGEVAVGRRQDGDVNLLQVLRTGVSGSQFQLPFHCNHAECRAKIDAEVHTFFS